MPTTTDILIIGGGVIGLSIARELHRRGVREITVIDKGTVGRGASWAAAGMLSPQAETDGVGPFFDLCTRSRELYPRFAAEMLHETGIDIELDRTGTLCLSFRDEDAGEMLGRCEWQRGAGLEVESLSAEEILKLEPHLSSLVTCGLRFPNDWQVDNRKLVGALHSYAVKYGIRVVENTPALNLVVHDGHVIGAQTAAGRIDAGATVLATGAWTSLINLGDVAMPVNVEPVRGQIVCLESEPGILQHVVYTQRGYLVPRRDGRILAGSTSENVGFEASTTDDATAALTEAANDILPAVPLRVVDAWAGLRPASSDGLPILGAMPGVNGLTLATGHYRNGILLAPVTATLMADSIVNGADSEAFTTFGVERLSAAVAAS